MIILKVIAIVYLFLVFLAGEAPGSMIALILALMLLGQVL